MHVYIFVRVRAPFFSAGDQADWICLSALGICAC